MIHALELPEAVLHELEATTVERRLSTIREFLQHRREQVAHQRRRFLVQGPCQQRDATRRRRQCGPDLGQKVSQSAQSKR